MPGRIYEFPEYNRPFEETWTAPDGQVYRELQPPSVIVRREWTPKAGTEDMGLCYQWATDSEGPGVQPEWWNGKISWFLFTHADDESPDTADTEAEALDWLWRRGPRLVEEPVGSRRER